MMYFQPTFEEVQQILTKSVLPTLTMQFMAHMKSVGINGLSVSKFTISALKRVGTFMK